MRCLSSCSRTRCPPLSRTIFFGLSFAPILSDVKSDALTMPKLMQCQSVAVLPGFARRSGTDGQQALVWSVHLYPAIVSGRRGSFGATVSTYQRVQETVFTCVLAHTLEQVGVHARA